MRIAVGISGGVDSAVTALLLKERGDDVVGVTMTLGRTDENRSLAEARAVAKRLDLPFEVCDFSKLWHEVVIGYIRETYLAGRTPNPCVRCNERIKFSALPRWAFETLGCDRFATGHYARTQGGRLFRGVDHAKDQSYFLYRVEKEILARTEFPLGGMTKEQVREVWMDEVEKRGGGGQRTDKHSTVHLFSPPPPPKESQDFCGGDPQALVGAADREGEVVTLDGKVIGKHRGYWHYTIGQRKGLGIGGGTPYYIVGLDAAQNRVIVGFKDAAVCHDFELTDTVGEIDRTLPVKVRSAGEPRFLADGIAGIAPGQSAVFYRGDEVVGGGIIVQGKEVGQ